MSNEDNCVFLEASWRNLCLLSYAVDKDLLNPFMPDGLEADLLDGSAFVSLVAFDFLDTKVFGIKWPGFVNFPEINLRFYVKNKHERGVVFIRELVPQGFVAAMAKLIYNEPYKSCPMRSSLVENSQELKVEHSIMFGGKNHSLRLSAENSPYTPPQDSKEHFFKEQRWGFGKDSKGKTTKYAVYHPVWEIYPVKEWDLDWDFGIVYGNDFAFLNQETAHSVMLARGSAIKVYWNEAS